MKRFLIFFIKCYQKLVSPFLGDNCRFYPSCSHYTKECFQKLSIWRAIWYSSLRILKCHPFHSGGYDPIPEEIVCSKNHNELRRLT